jgi:hypothetical protein
VRKQSFQRKGLLTINLYEIGYILMNTFNAKYGNSIIVYESIIKRAKLDFEFEDLLYLINTIVGEEGEVIVSSQSKLFSGNFYDRKIEFVKKLIKIE